jgi:hypothetical protein
LGQLDDASREHLLDDFRLTGVMQGAARALEGVTH